MIDELKELDILLRQTLNKVGLNRSEKRQLKHIMSTTPYRDKLSLYDDQNAIRAHQLFDKILTPDHERESIWRDQISKVISYSKGYDLKPIKEGRDNKNVRVGSGYPQGNTIRYPRKGHKNAWKKFYKLFPHLDPKNKKDENHK